MARKCIEKYLETHKSTYIGRYRCHSAVQTKKFEHKFHYYILDIQFKAIDVFVTIDYSGDEIVPTFSVNLHEQEQELCPYAQGHASGTRTRIHYKRCFK